MVLASKLAFSNGRFSASPSRNSRSACSPRATSSICVLKSRPTTRPSGPAIRASSAVSLPDPQAMSSAEPQALSWVSRAARRRQPPSIPADSTVLTRSYLRAMRSNIVRTAAGSRSEISLDPLPDRCDALADPDAHGGQSVLGVTVGHLAHERTDQPRPAAAERVAQGDRSAVDVDLLLVQPQHPQARKRLRRAGFVQLRDA